MTGRVTCRTRNSPHAQQRLVEGLYSPPGERPGCHNCIHGQLEAYGKGLTIQMKCKLLRAKTAKGGICVRFEEEERG